ncbi:hypothetical protein BDW42DRAFT_170208 [Aspergillus taichungensis]|uniref:Uncharacterized protein n=1 Tax=Aspergillus taichungensis TaxID=482145 RepID=A0A2J5HU00_9EURO|nr:hypothetical protein BDW42DRAFT_170208 [Aspergillus taichungensis]
MRPLYFILFFSIIPTFNFYKVRFTRFTFFSPSFSRQTKAQHEPSFFPVWYKTGGHSHRIVRRRIKWKTPVTTPLSLVLSSQVLSVDEMISVTAHLPRVEMSAGFPAIVSRLLELGRRSWTENSSSMLRDGGQDRSGRRRSLYVTSCSKDRVKGFDVFV